MNILTKNRILQKGDEYKNNGTWKPVPENDYGLQIMFTKYAEVRRPSEKPFPVSPSVTPSNDSHPAPTHANVQTSEGVKRSPSPDKPESGREPLSWNETSYEEVHGKGSYKALLKATGKWVETPEIALPKPLPIKIPDCIPPTPKPLPLRNCAVCNYDITQYPADVTTCNDCTPVHRLSMPNVALDVKAKLVPMTPEQLAIQAKGCGTNKIPFPKPDPTDLIAMSNQPIWTGRNGTFTGYALEAIRVNDNVMLSPVGKRGVGNCCIQFPVSVIPALVDWLEEQSKGTPKT